MTTTMLVTRSPRERELRGHDTERLELPMPRESSTLLDRFMAKVEIPDDRDACWKWTGATAGRDPLAPYGKIWAGVRTPAGNPSAAQAHRVSYELFVGPIPVGLEVDHLCRNTLCVNPTHLEPVTRRENLARSESPMARQARRTQCLRGHALDKENTYVWRGTRRCRRCNADQQAAIRKGGSC